MTTTRTQAEVDALWPSQDTYSITGRLTIPADNEQDAAKELQKLYEGHEAIAGAFQVESSDGQNIFQVVFTRDVHDDVDVVNDELLEGKPFNETLTSQLHLELSAAATADDANITILWLGEPRFFSR